MEVSFQEAVAKNLTYNLTGLQASTEYEVALSCAVEESAFWSGWSSVRSGTTEEEGKHPTPSSLPACSGREPGNPSPGAGLPGPFLSTGPPLGRQLPQQLSVPKAGTSTVSSLGRASP